MRMAITGDIHLDWSPALGKIDSATGYNTRLIDLVNSLDQFINYVINPANQITHCFMLGDIFHTAHPSETLEKEFATRVKRLSDSNIITYLLTGNHDVFFQEHLAHVYSIFEVLQVPRVTVIDKMQLVHLTADMDIVMVPYPIRSILGFETIDEVTQYVIKEIVKLKKSSTSKNIMLMGHFAPESATIHGIKVETLIGFKKECVIPLKVLKQFNGAFAGHLHRHQIICKDPVVAIPGSIDRFNFGETKGDKGFLIYDTDKKQCDFIPTKIRTLLDFKLEVNTTEEVLAFLVQQNVKDALVKITIKTHESNVPHISTSRIYEALKEARFYTTVEWDKIRDIRVRDASINEALPPTEALQSYIRTRTDLDEITKEEIITAGKNLIAELQRSQIDERT